MCEVSDEEPTGWGAPASVSETTAGDRREPAYQKASFVCPLCGAFAQQTWSRFKVAGSKGMTDTGLAGALCGACETYTVWRWETVQTDGDPWGSTEKGSLLWPENVRLGKDPSTDMPEDVKDLYEEARAVANASPRSAAALTRLALESMLKDLYPNAGNLNAMIGEAARYGLSAPVTQAMDILRFNGNAAVHELRREDNPEVVEALFDLLNLAVDQLIGQPRRIAEMYAAMPETFREQAAKRDGH